MSDTSVEVIVDADLIGIIPQFMQNVRDEIADLTLVGGEDYLLSASIFGHSLKGTGAAFGFLYLTDLGKALELSAKAGNRDETRDRLNEILDYINTVTYKAK